MQFEIKITKLAFKYQKEIIWQTHAKCPIRESFIALVFIHVIIVGFPDDNISSGFYFQKFLFSKKTIKKKHLQKLELCMAWIVHVGNIWTIKHSWSSPDGPKYSQTSQSGL